MTNGTPHHFHFLLVYKQSNVEIGSESTQACLEVTRSNWLNSASVCVYILSPDLFVTCSISTPLLTMSLRVLKLPTCHLEY